MMAYAILRTSKLKTKSAVGGSMKHTLREQETKNADPEKLKDNVILVEFDADKFYANVEAGRTRAEKGTKNDNVICIEVLMTTSNEHWDGKTRDDLDKWVEKNTEYLQNRYGKDNIRSLVLHLDETTPHLVAHIIPLKNDKLNTKDWLGGSAKMTAMQTTYAEQMAEFGLERGKQGSKAEHQTIQQYYAELNAIKAETLRLNPDYKVEVIADRLPKASFSDKLHMDEFAKKIATATIDQSQVKINELINQNKTLTAKLLTAESTIKRQAKELDKSREIVTKYDEVKDFIDKPKVAEAIHLEKNPHIAYVLNYRASGMNETDIAHKMITRHRTPISEVKAGLEYGRFYSFADASIKEAQERIVKENAIDKANREQAQAKADQEKAQADQRQQQQVRQDYINNNPHVRYYLKQASIGKKDKDIAKEMLLSKDPIFTRDQIVEAIGKESPNRPTRSDEARKWARGIVTDAKQEIDPVLKSKGGGMVIGGSSKKIERPVEREKSAMTSGISSPSISSNRSTPSQETSRPVGGGGGGPSLGDDVEDIIQELVDGGMSREKAEAAVKGED